MVGRKFVEVDQSCTGVSWALTRHIPMYRSSPSVGCRFFGQWNVQQFHDFELESFRTRVVFEVISWGKTPSQACPRTGTGRNLDVRGFSFERGYLYSDGGGTSQKIARYVSIRTNRDEDPDEDPDGTK